MKATFLYKPATEKTDRRKNYAFARGKGLEFIRVSTENELREAFKAGFLTFEDIFYPKSEGVLSEEEKPRKAGRPRAK